MQRDFFEDKIDRALRRLKDNAPNEPYYGATSDGKDSVVIMELARMAGVKVEWYYNVTTVDPPELVRFIKKKYPMVIFDKPKMNMWQLIIKKRMPPTRKLRYCCEYLKERGGDGRVVITGVRRSESIKRKNRQSVECHSISGINKIVVNPIIDWNTFDVWSFIRENHLPYCSLYDEGFKRLGCIGCPMTGKKTLLEEFERWPHFKMLYIKAFSKMIEKRRIDDLKTDSWNTGEDVFDWWIKKNKGIHDDKQLSLFG